MMCRKNSPPKKMAGRTIVAKKEPEKPKKENLSLDTERDRLRKRAKKRTTTSVIGIIVLIILVGGSLALVGKNIVDLALEPEETVSEQTAVQPTVQVYDENGTGEISSRTKEYIGLLESDLKDLGYTMSRASLPVGKMREVDINIEGITPYFKVNIERGSAVSAEDIVRMIKYLQENSLLESVTYVDVRIDGKAYYK